MPLLAALQHHASAPLRGLASTGGSQSAPLPPSGKRGFSRRKNAASRFPSSLTDSPVAVSAPGVATPDATLAAPDLAASPSSVGSVCLDAVDSPAGSAFGEVNCRLGSKPVQNTVLRGGQQAIFDACLTWADEVARRAARHLPRHEFPFKDMRQLGRIALWQAAAAYDPDTNVPFSAFAFMRIRGAVLMAARRHKSYKWATERTTISESHADDGAGPAAIDAAVAIERLMRVLSEQERTLVRHVYIRGLTIGEAAKSMKIRIGAARRMEEEAIERMRRAV